MSQRYFLLAEVKHRITDVITLTVEAESEEEAFAKAKEVLEVFPRPVEQEGVPYCYIENRFFEDTEVTSIENMKKEKGA